MRKTGAWWVEPAIGFNWTRVQRLPYASLELAKLAASFAGNWMSKEDEGSPYYPAWKR